MSTATMERTTKKTTVKASRPYEPWLKARLAADPEEAQYYLEAAMEDEDPRVFLLALKHVAEASGGIGELAKASGLNRVNLYRMLSERGNPELLSVSRVLNVLGLRLTVEARTQTVRRTTAKATAKRDKAIKALREKIATALARQTLSKPPNVLIKRRA
jgi:probable addiction module antidote protein